MAETELGTSGQDLKDTSLIARVNSKGEIRRKHNRQRSCYSWRTLAAVTVLPPLNFGNSIMTSRPRIKGMRGPTPELV